jgi:hypothetical protein
VQDICAHGARDKETALVEYQAILSGVAGVSCCDSFLPFVVILECLLETVEQV